MWGVGTGALIYFFLLTIHLSGSTAVSNAQLINTTGHRSLNFNGIAFSEQSIQGERLPPDFSWQSYLAYHPNLIENGLTTRQQAVQHYLTQGQYKKLLFRRLRVILRYTAGTGLINQLYSHIAALTLAAYLGAEIVLPPALKRDSFAHYFSSIKEQNEVVWSAAPLESLIDVDELIAIWAKKGLIIHRTVQLLPFPDLTEPETAFLRYTHPGADARFEVRVGGIYARRLDLEDLVEISRRAVVDKAEQLMRENATLTVDHMVLDFPCTFFMLRSVSAMRLVSDVARSFRWASKVQQLADTVIREVKRAEGSHYNSVHLRIEKDARDWAKIIGGEQVLWQRYVDTMRQAGFNPDQGIYIASGLLTYGADDEMSHLVSTMKELGLCRVAHYKELYLPKWQIEELDSEQKALLDFLVLGEGESFAGFGPSTFSFYLREHRSLAGIPTSKSLLVDAPIIGTDQLFAEAGHVS